jgi:hypothetical protein
MKQPLFIFILVLGLGLLFLTYVLQKETEAFDLSTYDKARKQLEEAEREIAILVEKNMPPDPCRKYTTCQTCAAGMSCGWCPNANVCTAMDRWGYPMHGECHPSQVAFFPYQCSS